MPSSFVLPDKTSSTYHHGDLRRAFIQAALAEVEQKGFEAISMKALAKHLGVSQPAPYRHFADRDALLSAVAMEGFRDFIAILKEAVAAPSSHPPSARIAHAYVSFGLNRYGLYRLMFTLDVRPSDVNNAALQEISQESFNLLLDALDPDIPPSQRYRTALRIWVALHGTIMLKHGMLHNKITTDILEKLVDDIIAS